MHDLKIDHMAKIYGHASLEVSIRGKEVKKAHLNIFESSRFFESMVKGKRFDEVRRITSRICGICAASHNITSIMAVEDAMGISPPRQVRDLREAMILGGWIQSHALHAYFLALPDYMGYEGILDMADKHPDEVERAFRLKKLGNDIVTAIGGRATHPVTTDVGRFTSVPAKDDLERLAKPLETGLKDARQTLDLFSSFKKPHFERARAFGSLVDDETYAIVSGDPVINGAKISLKDFAKKVRPESRPYSTSKFLTFNGKEYMTGPLARLNANHSQLSHGAKAALERSGLGLPDNNPFNSNIARIVEMIHCIERCMEIIEGISPHKQEEMPAIKESRGMRTGVAITEAPRGMLYHEYKIDREGFIVDSNIITPTAQNLTPMESDVKAFLPSMLGQPKEKIITALEELIRSYDPCISCSTHFLDVKFT